jgi:hypothetical protein
MKTSIPPKAPGWVWASVVVTALLSLWSLSFRYRVEASNRAVGLVVEGPSVVQLSALEGISFADGLNALKDAGLTAVALQEETLDDLVKSGRARATSAPSGGTVIDAVPEVRARIERGLARRGRLGERAAPGLTGLVVEWPYTAIADVSAGIDPALATEAGAVGIGVVARHFNPPGAEPRYIRDVLEESRSHGAVAYLPSGEQVLGHRGMVEDAAVALVDVGLTYLSPEFVKTAGDESLKRHMPAATLRLHAMQAAEIDRAGPSTVLERYAKAARERNVRWLLLRPLQTASQAPLTDFRKFVWQVKTAVERERGAVRPPRPFADPGVPNWLFWGIGVAMAPSVFWSLFTLVAGRAASAVGVLGAVLAAGASFTDGFRPYAALAASLAFPVLAFSQFAFAGRGWIGRFVLVLGVSLVGGLAVAGLLNSLETLLQIESFSGVKVAHFLPIVLVGWLALRWLADPRELAARPVLWGTALVSLVAVAAVAFMLSRTGNDNPAGVSGAELQFRALLDRVLGTRPRTKEFLIGHPALIVGLALQTVGTERARAWSVALIVLGTIGATSVVNTMCHLHTPLDVGLTRIAIGALVGGILAAPVAIWARGLAAKATRD